MGNANGSTLGARLVRARLEYGARMEPARVVTQLEIGERLGVSGVAVGGWEADRSEPGLERLKVLAALYGVRAAWLAFGELPVRDEGGGSNHHEPSTPRATPRVVEKQTLPTSRPKRGRSA